LFVFAEIIPLGFPCKPTLSAESYTISFFMGRYRCRRCTFGFCRLFCILLWVSLAQPHYKLIRSALKGYKHCAI